MLPLFKSHYSVGKSILTLAPASITARNGSAGAQNDVREELPEGPSNIFNIAAQHNLDTLVLVEDSLVGFLEAKKCSEEADLHLVFGLRLDFCENLEESKTAQCAHKIIVFAKNTAGCKLINKIYSFAQTMGGGAIDSLNLKRLYNPKDLRICIPFYDSFLFHNCLSYKEPCILDHSFFEPTFFIEDNLLPFDELLKGAVENYCADQYPIERVKSIYYENREDFEAYQTYKCICGRGFSTRAKTLDMPNLDHCGSPEFCFESYLEHESV